MTGASFMGILLFCIVVFIVIVFAGIAKANIQSEKEDERNEDLNRIASSVDDFTVTNVSNGYGNHYRFMVDNTHKNVCYINGIRKIIIPYSKILSVELIENGTTISSKSTARTVGGALIGGVLAGTAGAIIGGLSGDTKQKHMVSKVQVKIRLKDVSNPYLVIDAFNSSRMIGSSVKEIDANDALYGNVYRQCLSKANTIIDMVSAIIDEVDKNEGSKQKTQVVHESSLADELKKLAGLKKDGILTESEFNAMKAKLLGTDSKENSSENSEIISEGESISEEVKHLLDSGHMLQAMNQYIKETGASISEAKRILDSYM